MPLLHLGIMTFGIMNFDIVFWRLILSCGVCLVALFVYFASFIVGLLYVSGCRRHQEKEGVPGK